MDINNYSIKIEKNQKKGKKISGKNSTYLFYIFWIIKDCWLKQQKNSKKRLLDLDIRKIYEKLKEKWPLYEWKIQVIYKLIAYLVKTKVIQTEKIGSKLLILKVFDLKQHYIPKRILDLGIQKQKLVSPNYFRIYQYFANLAISNFRLNSKQQNYQIENSYAYFEKLGFCRQTIAAGLKWIQDNNLEVQFENKILSKKYINHINLEKNKFFKGIKYQKELVLIKLENSQKIVYRQKQQGRTYFYAKTRFSWKVQKTVIYKIKKFFEYLIKRPCYSLKKVKSGWNYANCWCKNKGQHWSINQENPKYKSYYRDKNTIIRRLGQSFESWLYGRLKHIKSSWFLNLKIIN